MWQRWRLRALWILAWAVIFGAGAAAIARGELAQLRETFETDARIAHRMLSQRVAQHDAVLSTLALLQPVESAERPQQRLSSVYSQIMAVERRARDAPWRVAHDLLSRAEAASREARRAALAGVDMAAGRYWLVLAAEPSSHALLIGIGTMVPREAWPLQGQRRISAALEYHGQRFELQPDAALPGGWTFAVRKPLASDSQPFTLVASRQVGWNELPWRWMLGWALASGAALGATAALLRLRRERRRAEALLRLGRTDRLSALGELGAGIAHELNQPLTAVLASAQAARRLLDETPPDLATAREAIGTTAAQARRASDVLGRLRSTIERPDPAVRVQPVRLEEAVRDTLYLLEPELRRRGIVPAVDARSQVTVSVDPVALAQVIHNLVTNALQALDGIPESQRSLELGLSVDGARAAISVRDSGPGIAPKALPRIFEPFFTTREGGLGLGLSLCETLVTAMGGTLSARNRAPRGAEFIVSLPLTPSVRTADR